MSPSSLKYLAILIALTVVSAKSIDDAASKETETERIIGGSDATLGQFPYAAALYYNDQFICTSSIISPTTVLTAAHCVVFNDAQQPADLFYAIANVDRTAPSVRIDFERVTVHPQYSSGTVDNDVAVFKTIEPIPITDDVSPVCIARPNTSPSEYRNATAMGWGTTSRVMSVIPDILQYAEQRIVQNFICSISYFGNLNGNKICARGKLTGVCNGDSGGPLVHLSRDKRPVQIGITSYVNSLAGCATVSSAVFTRVSSYYDFIMQTADDSSICTV